MAQKDPRVVELILRESTSVLRCRPGVIIVEHRSGLVMANAGIDASNVDGMDGDDRVLLLPEDADRSAPWHCVRPSEADMAATSVS